LHAFDFTQPLSAQLTGSEEKYLLKDVVNVGFFWAIGLKKWPLAVTLGASNLDKPREKKELRIGLSLDMPLIRLNR
jgi:hypothetical protein